MNRGHVPSSLSRSSHRFSAAPQARIQRSRFNRSHTHKTTFDAGYLIPIFVDEALPGDTFNVHLTAFSRLSTPIFPIMDNLVMETFFFAVPYRLVWDHWQEFNGEKKDPDDVVDYLVPQVASPTGGWLASTIYDYFGLPTTVANLKVNSLHFRAYNLIYNEWFRDENLQKSVKVSRTDGPDDSGDFVLLRRGKRYDYFTSSLPWPQKGPAVELPLGKDAEVVSTDTDIYMKTVANATPRAVDMNRPVGLTLRDYPTEVGVSAARWVNPALKVDLASATSATINQLRQSFQVQKLYERDARGGTRYTEIIKSHFGVVSSDARLQRPEYLGGGSTPVIVNPIAQTSAVKDQPSPLGNLAAYGTCGFSNHGFTKSFTEHCLLLGLVCVRADLNYQQGVNRMFSRRTRFDFYWPALSHIGEQSVLNKEIYAQGNSSDDQVFGYQERFAEYRYKPSIVTGQFRSNFKTSLDSWHLAQDFKNLPSLNAEFIVENPPMARIKAVGDSPDFIFDSFFNMSCVRPMPVYSVPGLVDHF